MSSGQQCICDKASTGFMVACENCNIWYHARCIGLSKKYIEQYVADYYCDKCRKKNPSLEITYNGGIQPPEPVQPKIKQEPLEERKQSKKILEKHRPEPTAPKPKVVTISALKPAQTRRKGNQRAKSKSQARKQCSNPDCVYEQRQDSKYCSDECGYAFNKKRYDKFYVPKYKLLESNHSQARLEKMKDLDRLEKDKASVDLLIKNLKFEKEELDQSIKLIKEEAAKQRKQMAISKKNEDNDLNDMDQDGQEEATTGDLSKIFCVSCGMAIPKQKTFLHWSACHRKQESQYNFTADIEVHHRNQCEEDNDPKLYCHFQDKKTKRFCMNMKSACPHHSNWAGDKDEVCGCPLNIMQKLVADGNYCLELKKDCQQHYHWDRFRLAQLNMQRIHAFSKLDLIMDKIRTTQNNLADTYGGIVGVMLHNTISHRGDVEDEQISVE